MRKTVTLKFLEKVEACEEGIELFKEIFGRKAALKDVINYCIDNHQDNPELLNHANWLITKCMNRKQCISYAIFSAESVIHIFENIYPDDARAREAIEAAKAVLERDTKKNREASRTAAWAAAWAAAGASAWAAARAAAWAAAGASAGASAAAGASAGEDDAWAAAGASAASAGEDLMIKILKNGLQIMGLN